MKRGAPPPALRVRGAGCAASKPEASGGGAAEKGAPPAAQAQAGEAARRRSSITLVPVSYTHLTLPTTPYV